MLGRSVDLNRRCTRATDTCPPVTVEQTESASDTCTWGDAAGNSAIAADGGECAGEAWNAGEAEGETQSDLISDRSAERDCRVCASEAGVADPQTLAAASLDGDEGAASDCSANGGEAARVSSGVLKWKKSAAAILGFGPPRRRRMDGRGRVTRY